MSETYTVTLEVDVDTENLDKQVQTEFTDVAGKEIKGTVEADLDDVLKDTVTSVTLVESDAPEPIGFAVEHAIMKRK